MKHYNIDESQVYANGYSGGGETMSHVLGKRPELFTAYLHCSSQWDGDLNVLAKSRTPVYLVVGREDEYYGSAPSQKAYDTLHKLYQEQGLSEEEIGKLLVLDIKERSYFTSKGMNNEHGGGNLFAAAGEIMSWLFSKTKRTALSGTIPEELEYVPEGYERPAEHPGRLEKLEYHHGATPYIHHIEGFFSGQSQFLWKNAHQSGIPLLAGGMSEYRVAWTVRP